MISLNQVVSKKVPNLEKKQKGTQYLKQYLVDLKILIEV